ncbi:hypothetical protein EDD80_102113 [Anseongella ginsenosidimutans]|uniref:Uncharacterized protein n=2 Tax=Anseongella ginsenosidimutans TaxID=496056 RepID=A0A4R3KY58_9SPHI|nr:hypothetical protein EDD80_102113 [Anseongella ginsenosidimutans]
MLTLFLPNPPPAVNSEPLRPSSLAMKQITIILLLAGAFPIAKASPTLPSNDTIFIFRKVTEWYYHAIYIEKDKKSETYKRAIDFSFEEWDRRNYRSQKALVEREAPGSFVKRETFDLPQNWLPLYKYKDKYYLYDPSDGQCSRTMIKSREYISWGMEGPGPWPMKSVKKISDTRYTLELLNPFDHLPSVFNHITIHIIDPETKMAIFEYTSQDGFYHFYRLFIPAAHASNFDLIVNYCDKQRQMEFQFEKIDYAKLLDNRGSK